MSRTCASNFSRACFALLFLYRDVLAQELGWLDNIVPAKRPQRLPTVLSREEVRALLGALDGLDGVGRPLFSALRQLPVPIDPFGRAWRASELVREHRGDGDLAASVAAGLDMVTMNVLTELWLLLRRHATLEKCDLVVSGLLERGLRREPLQPESYARAWDLGREWPDQNFSLTDRQAFVAIERSRHLRAWSYDNDFVVIRLGPRHSKSLDIVR